MKSTRRRKQASPSPEEIRSLIEQIRAVRKRATSKKQDPQPSTFIGEVSALSDEFPVFNDQARAVKDFEQALLAAETIRGPIPIDVCLALWDALEIIAIEWQATAQFYERQIGYLQADNAELSQLLYQGGTQIFAVKEAPRSI